MIVFGFHTTVVSVAFFGLEKAVSVGLKSNYLLQKISLFINDPGIQRAVLTAKIYIYCPK